MTGIYKITNLINKKVYIGQALDIFHRWSKHSSAPTNSLIHQAIREYGIENFSFEIIEQCEKDVLAEMLVTLGINPQVRSEVLSVNDFVRIAYALENIISKRQ